MNPRPSPPSRPRFLAVAAALALLPGLVQAAGPAPAADAPPVILSAGDLADLCAATPNDAGGQPGRNICLGFALGVMAIADRQQAAGGARFFCPPNPPPPVGETMDGFVQLTKALPPMRSAPVIDGLLQFLQQRFPCKP